MNTNPPSRSQRLYTNVALTVIAGATLAMWLDRSGVSLISTAQAQPRQPQSGGRSSDDIGDGNSLMNAAEQRKAMIAELRTLNGRMEHVEAILAKPMPVKVVDMPPIQISDKDKGDKSDKKDKDTKKPQ
jgi:hypothetical protein